MQSGCGYEYRTPSGNLLQGDHGLVELLLTSLDRRWLGGRGRLACTLRRNERRLLLLRRRLRLGEALLGGRSGRVEGGHGLGVLHRVALEHASRGALLGRVDLGLHFVRVDEAREVRVAHLQLWQPVGGAVVHLGGGRLGGGAEDRIELLERILRPHAEAAHVPARRELQQVESIDVSELHTRDVAEGAFDAAVAVEDDERSAALHKAAAAHLTLTRTHRLRRDDFLNVLVRAKLFEHGNCSRRL
mmetsp:Transcript_893/g.1949  ORF Transcript_893/g.1949 Transcript_893/m.1949 type:complete len:245 (+) Transcript_893:285-1019(+)